MVASRVSPRATAAPAYRRGWPTGRRGGPGRRGLAFGGVGPSPPGGVRDQSWRGYPTRAHRAPFGVVLARRLLDDADPPGP